VLYEQQGTLVLSYLQTWTGLMNRIMSVMVSDLQMQQASLM
jgi:hypothetical protein